jgi:hypothetical protein
MAQSLMAGDRIWVADTARGADTGADSANAHSAAWFNTAANWGGGGGDIDPGDEVMLTGTIATPLTVQGSGRADAPITVRFDAGARLSLPTWTSSGALIANGKRYIRIDGGIIESTANGVGLSYTNNDRHVNLSNCGNVTLSGVTTRNVFVPAYGGSNAYGNALYALGCSGLTVSNCAFLTGGKICYVGYGGGSSNVVMVGNTVSNCIVGITIGSGGAGSTLDGLTLKDNTIANGTNWGGSWANGTVWHHIDGIHLFAAHTSTWITNAVIDANRIGAFNPTYISGGVAKSTATAWLYIEANVGEIYAPIVKNNILRVGAGVGQGPMLGMVAVKRGTAPSILNNTFIGSGDGTGVYIGSLTGESFVQNNIFARLNMATYLGSLSPRPRFDSNCYYQNKYVGRLATSYCASLSPWQAALGGAIDGNDKDSKSDDPLFVDTNAADYRLADGSPCIDQGVVAIGVDKDQQGMVRPQGVKLDIGAYEFSRCTEPKSPLLLSPEPPSKVRVAPQQ